MKKACLISLAIVLLVSFISVSCGHTAPATARTKTVGGSGDERAYSVQQTSNGGYVIAGFTHSYAARGVDVWLTKVIA